MSATPPAVPGDPAENILFEQRGNLGLITLNRPRAINALTHDMVNSIQGVLNEWQDNDEIGVVALVGSGERGLCAGGDIVSLYHDAQAGNGEASAAFWRDEYRLNACIANYAKPYLAIMDGIVLGGGIGLSAHASHRIVTERSKLGLPEAGIGFVPDVGATWLLSHAPGELGTHLALSGGSARAGDAIHMGLADFFVPSDRTGDLLRDLETTDASAAVARVAETPPQSELEEQRSWIDQAYEANSVSEIVKRLHEAGNPAASKAADAILTKSPIAATVTLESLRRARNLPSLEDALVQEYRVSLHAHRSADFVEGIRAQVIDKDREPRWKPSTLDAVQPSTVEGYFRPLDDAELTFASPR